MHPDHQPYARFTTRARLDKSINSLSGIIAGVSIDGAIKESEVRFLQLWLDEHEELKGRHPFNELVPVVRVAVADGILTTEERSDIFWLCERLRSTKYFGKTTADLQRLHAIIGGIIADGRISEDELRGLSSWLAGHEHLKTCWPYDEIDSLVTSVLSDKRIDAQEHALLQNFFSECVAMLDERAIVSPLVADGATTIKDLCAVSPDITFHNSTFCFTGTSTRYTPPEFEVIVAKRGGRVTSSVSTKVRYLVIGADGNPCWAYACYGRKVQRAVELRRSGARLLLVHETDFHAAVAEHLH